MPVNGQYRDSESQDNTNIVEFVDHDWDNVARKHRMCGVYVFDMIGTPYCKIGSTGTPVERFRAVSTFTPFKVTFPYFVSSDGGVSHVEIELAAQGALDHVRHSGEWFECSKDEAMNAIRSCISERSGL